MYIQEKKVNPCINHFTLQWNRYVFDHFLYGVKNKQTSNHGWLLFLPSHYMFCTYIKGFIILKNFCLKKTRLYSYIRLHFLQFLVVSHFTDILTLVSAKSTPIHHSTFFNNSIWTKHLLHTFIAPMDDLSLFINIYQIYCISILLQISDNS